MSRNLRYVAVVGSRCATREDVINAIKSCNLTPKHHAIVSGGCKSGADKHARSIAEEWGFHYAEIPAFWSRGKHAGMARNSIIVDISDAVIAVWDGHSSGTKDTIDKAEAAGKKLQIFVAMHGIAEAEASAPKRERVGL